MYNKNIVGVGNIYANEALFLSGINPKKTAGRISFPAYETLASNIIEVLSSAIKQGGTTLQDFSGNDGKPGYFRQKLYVYGRGGKPCLKCKSLLKEIRLGQRSSVYCSTCQK
jgi:formamidopyrimidine-DNA glycosylase